MAGRILFQQFAADATTRVLRLIPPRTRGKARLARLAVHWQPNPPMLRDLDGNIFFVPSLHEPVAFYLWSDGEYEPELLEVLNRFISPDSSIFDVGANIGCFAIPLAKRVSRGKVIAIEASPSVAPFLRRNRDTNGLENLIVIECAAGNEDGASLSFFPAPADHFGMGSLSPQFGNKPVVVISRTLDSIAVEQGVVPSVMKLDVEGYEAKVFEGATQILTSPNPPAVAFEFCDWAEERAFPGRVGYAQEVLLNLGFALWTLESFQSSGPALDKPLRTGTHTIVAVRR